MLFINYSMSTALVVLYLQTQDSLNIEWPSGSEAQAQRERRVRGDDALILWHSELITQLFHTLQSPGHWQSCLIIHHNAAAVPPGQDKERNPKLSTVAYFIMKLLSFEKILHVFFSNSLLNL